MGEAAKFCDQCGAALGSETARNARATRKVVSVLFADLVGSTSFGEQVDAESAREAMTEFHAMVQATIDAADGTVAKFIGDGVMALFGVPETAEDDADRAVAAALKLQQGFVPIRGRVLRRHRIELGLRVGINTGEIVLADGDADLVGDVINTAARLEAACTPGHVLVGEDTWRLTRSRVRYEVLGEVSVKGKDEPVATFRVADDELHDDAATPFVGRAAELGQLRAEFDLAVEQRAARLATVIGAPGVGKTRIAREFAESLGEAAVVAELRCERAGTATFAPIADLLRSVTTIDDDTDADQVRVALRRLVADLDDADRITELLAGFLGAASPRSTEEAFLAVRRLVEATGRQQPLVVVVDDIQWAEPLFLDLLEHLVDWVRDAPALLIGLARPELRDLRPSLAEESRTLATAIGLEGLDAAATAELAAQLVGAASLPPELVARLPDSTEGNPLFVRELMRMLVDDGVIDETADGWQLTIDVDAVEVPPTIQSLLAARLDRMPSDERRLIELASVVGPEFPLGAVTAISESGPAELRSLLERLRRRELVEPTGMYWGDEPIHRFHHVLIRDAAYRRLLKRARADLHLRVGEWTERTAVGLTGEHEVAVGHHFEQAHEYHRQLDDVDEKMAAVGRRAAELFGVAAERALERDDLPAAAGLAERALARLDEGDTRIPPLLVVAAEALLGLGDVTHGRPLVERLSAAVRGDERLVPWADAFVAQLTMLTEPDRLHEAEEQADAAASRLADLGDEAGVAKARLVRAVALARLGQVGQCEAELDQALTAARSAADRRRVAAVLGAAPVAALWGPSPIPRAGGRCLDVIRLLRITTGSPAVEATSVRCQAVLEALRGRFDTARSMLSDSRATVEELGLRHALGETDLFAGIVELLAGEPEAAEGPLREAYDALGRLGIGADAGQAAAHLARAVLLQGRIDEAEALAGESAELAGENPQTAIAARTAQAEILAARGRYDEAMAVARDAVGRAEGTDIIVDHAAASAVLAQVAGLAGDGEAAVRAARMAVDLYEQKAATVSVASVAEPSANTADEQAPEAPAPADAEDGHEPLNEADRLTRRFVEAFTAGAREEWVPMLAPDQVTTDRRPLGVDTTGAAEVAATFPRNRETGALSSEVETIAVRGESLALVQWKAASGHGREWDGLHLTRWTAEGLNDLNIIFPPDQLDEALAELERLQRDALTSETPAVRAMRDVISALDDRTFVQRGDEFVAAGYTHTDHRPVIGHGPYDFDELVALLSTAGQATLTLEPIAVRGDRLALWQGVTTYESGSESAYLGVAEVDAVGRVIRTIFFDSDNIDRARTELDRLWFASLRPRQQEVSRLAVALGEAWVAPSMHPFDELLAPDFEFADRRTLGMGSLDRPGFEAALRGREADGASGVPVPSRVQFVSDDVMVFRANNLGHAPDSGIDWEEIACNTLVAEGERIIRLEMFDEDHWNDAVARAEELDRSRVAGRDGSAPTANSASRRLDETIDRMNAGESAGDVIADDFVRDDRRHHLAFPEHGADELRQLLETNTQMGARHAITHLAVRGERFVLSILATSFDGGDGVVEMLTLAEFDDAGRLLIETNFETDRLDEALAELDERWTATVESFELDQLDEATVRAEDPIAGRGGDRRVDNAAARWADRAVSVGGVIGVDAFSEGFVREDRRSGVAADRTDREGLVESLRVQREMGAAYDWEPIAVRGERFALGRLGVSYGDNDIWFLSLVEVTDEGPARRMVHFDPDDLAAAQDALDEIFASSLPADDAATLRTAMAFRDAYAALDMEQVVPLLGDDFETVDHRPAGWPSMDRERFAAANDDRKAVMGESHILTTEINRIENGVILAANVLTGIAPDTGAEWSEEFVNVFVASDGRMWRVESFLPSDLEVARARSEELIAHREVEDAPLRNEMVGWIQRTLTADGRITAELDDFATDFVRIDRRSVGSAEPADRSAFLHSLRTHAAMGSRYDHRPLAIRGNHLALFEITVVANDSPIELLVIGELDGQRRLRSFVHFDPHDLAAAQDELDRRYVARLTEEQAATLRPGLQFRSAMSSTGTGEMSALLADDFVAIDHRDLAFPELDRDDFLEINRQRDELFGEALVFTTEIHRIEGDVIVASNRMAGITPASGVEWLHEFVNIFVVRGGELHVLENFGPDDLDRAIARSDELLSR